MYFVQYIPCKELDMAAQYTAPASTLCSTTIAVAIAIAIHVDTSTNTVREKYDLPPYLSTF
jgi:hypothetical protein